MIVLDEAHHTVKDHPFAVLVSNYVVGSEIRTIGTTPRGPKHAYSFLHTPVLYTCVVVDE